MQIRIRKRPQTEVLVQYIFILPFFFFLLMDICRVPSVIKYTIDVAWLLLLVTMVLSKVKLPYQQAGKILRVVALFFLLTLIGFGLEYQSVLYYLWGLRNNARFFVFFMACILFLSQNGVEECLHLMDKLFSVNVVVSLFQFFVMDKRQDYLGGIFGIEKGCNAYTNIFMMIVVAWHVLQYVSKKETFRSCLMISLLALLIAALAELKFFYLEFIGIVVLAVMFTQHSGRKVWIVMGGLVALLVGLQIVQTIFPDFAGWFTPESIWETASSTQGYTGKGDMNRLTAISMSWNGFLDTPLRKLFGLGLGNCDYASGFDFITTPFFRKYIALRYFWFSTSFMILETGVLGLSVYCLFFIAVFYYARQREKDKQAIPIYCQLTSIIALMCLLLIVYNSSMRTESAYMVYFVLALPFIKQSPTTSDTSPDDTLSPTSTSLEGGHPQ